MNLWTDPWPQPWKFIAVIAGFIITIATMRYRLTFEMRKLKWDIREYKARSAKRLRQYEHDKALARMNKTKKPDKDDYADDPEFPRSWRFYVIFWSVIFIGGALLSLPWGEKREGAQIVCIFVAVLLSLFGTAIEVVQRAVEQESGSYDSD